MAFAILGFCVLITLDLALIWLACFLGSGRTIRLNVSTCLHCAVAIFITAAIITGLLADPPLKLPTLAIGQFIAAFIWLFTCVAKETLPDRLKSTLLAAIPYATVKLLVWVILEPDIIRF